MAAITIIQGFAAARDHAHLSAARELVERLGEALSRPSTDAMTSDRERAEELIALADEGLQPDGMARRIVGLSWAWAAGTLAITIGGGIGGVLGEPLEVFIVGGVATTITVTVALLGFFDSRSVRVQLQQLRKRTSVGLLADAHRALRADEPEKAVVSATLAGTRNPRMAWPFLLRAQAYLALGRHEEADADIERLLQRDPAQFAGMFDELARHEGLALTDRTVERFEAAHILAPLDARRRLWSFLGGHARRRALAATGDGSRIADAVHAWRRGDLARVELSLADPMGRKQEEEARRCLLGLLFNALGRHRDALAVTDPVCSDDEWASIRWAIRAEAASTNASTIVEPDGAVPDGLRRLVMLVLGPTEQQRSSLP